MIILRANHMIYVTGNRRANRMVHIADNRCCTAPARVVVPERGGAPFRQIFLSLVGRGRKGRRGGEREEQERSSK